MSLGRLALAWVLVATWFVTASFGSGLLVANLSKRSDQPGVWTAVPGPLLKWRIVEAALLTMLASLWFDSLGSGGWWLLFLLVGALATIPTWLRLRPEQPRAPALLIGACADVTRYVVAGALLAWRLA